jgi:hypothetical protein
MKTSGVKFMLKNSKNLTTKLNQLWSLLLVNLLLIIVSISGADAAIQTIDGLRVSGLPANQVLNVFYATGRPPTVDFGGMPNLRIVKHGPVKVQIDSDGRANLPAVSITRVGFDVVNFVVFDVVSPDQDKAYIENPDCTVPSDSVIPNPERLDLSAYKSLSTGYVDIVALGKLKSAQNSSAIALTFGKDIKIAPAPATTAAAQQ